MQSTKLPALIGVTGKAGVGKDTLADYLCITEGYTRYSLAGPLKRGIEAMFSLPSSIWDRDRKEVEIPWIGKSPRQLAQTLGTEWGRDNVASDIWLRCLGNFLNSNPGALVVVPDVRFDNEASYIRSLGGVVLEIQREVPGVSAHTSEKGVSRHLIDGFLGNNGTPLDYCSNAYLLLSSIHYLRTHP